MMYRLSMQDYFWALQPSLRAAGNCHSGDFFLDTFRKWRTIYKTPTKNGVTHV